MMAGNDKITRIGFRAMLTSAKKNPAARTVTQVLPTLKRSGPNKPEATQSPSDDTAQRVKNLVAKCCNITYIVPSGVVSYHFKLRRFSAI